MSGELGKLSSSKGVEERAVLAVRRALGEAGRRGGCRGFGVIGPMRLINCCRAPHGTMLSSVIYAEDLRFAGELLRSVGPI